MHANQFFIIAEIFTLTMLIVNPLLFLALCDRSSADPSSGESPLHVAVTLNNEAVVLQLLELGASQSCQDLEGKTPVMKACEYGHLQSLESLATRGMNVTGKVEPFQTRGIEG